MFPGQEGRQELLRRTRGAEQEVQEEGAGEVGTAGREGNGEQEEQGEGQGRQEWEVRSALRPGGQPEARMDVFRVSGGWLSPSGRHCDVAGTSRKPGPHWEQCLGPGPWH